LEMGVFLHRGSAGGLDRGCCFTRDFEKKVRFLTYQKALFTGESKRYVKWRFWKRATLSTLAPLGNLEEGSFTRDWQTVKVIDKWSVSLSLWELCEGNLEGGLLYWQLWKLGLKSTQRQAQKLILGFSPAVKTRI
jgi:hypothetical protein